MQHHRMYYSRYAACIPTYTYINILYCTKFHVHVGLVIILIIGGTRGFFFLYYYYIVPYSGVVDVQVRRWGPAQ